MLIHYDLSVTLSPDACTDHPEVILKLFFETPSPSNDPDYLNHNPQGTDNQTAKIFHI